MLTLYSLMSFVNVIIYFSDLLIDLLFDLIKLKYKRIYSYIKYTSVGFL